jgi:16S rRNA (guanine966-N2)-methyltransferase
VRESVFNALGSLGAIEGTRVLDLFAGSGALGIEALSRGAASAVFVEQDRLAVASVTANLDSTGLSGAAEVVRRDADRYLAAAPGSFDLVLLDPPYRFADWDELLAALEPAVAADAVVVIESDREVDLPGRWRVERRKRYSSTFIAIVRPPESHRPSQPEPC